MSLPIRYCGLTVYMLPDPKPAHWRQVEVVAGWSLKRWEWVPEQARLCEPGQVLKLDGDTVYAYREEFEAMAKMLDEELAAAGAMPLLLKLGRMI